MPGPDANFALCQLATTATGHNGAAATSAWIAAGVALAVGSATVLANLWIARGQRQTTAQQPARERSVTSAQERDGRIRAVVEAAETIRIRCWEVSAVCRKGDPHLASESRDRLARQTEFLKADTELLYQRWSPLRPDLSQSEHDQLLAGRIICMEALDALVTAIAVESRLLPPTTTAIRDAVAVLDAAARNLVEDLLVLRRAWSISSGVA